MGHFPRFFEVMPPIRCLSYDLVTPEFSPCLTGVPLPTLESKRMVAAGCGASCLVLWHARGVPERTDTYGHLCPQAPIWGPYMQSGVGGAPFFPEPAQHGPWDPFREREARQVQRLVRRHTVFFLSLQPGWGGQGKGLAEASAPRRSEEGARTAWCTPG